MHVGAIILSLSRERLPHSVGEMMEANGFWMKYTPWSSTP